MIIILSLCAASFCLIIYGAICNSNLQKKKFKQNQLNLKVATRSIGNAGIRPSQKRVYLDTKSQ